MTFSTTFRAAFFASATLLGTAAMAAQALVPAQSSINFTAKQMGVPSRPLQEVRRPGEL
jgi:polyisoprenoid-binding protein YceI